MNKSRLKRLIFMAICCSTGVVAKKLISPFANIITDSLHIPGGIGTGFSLMFLVMASVLAGHFGSGALMGAVQSFIAICLGTVGSMGALAPIGYILPGFIIDLVLFISDKLKLKQLEKTVLANALSSASAALVANLIVFHLSATVLILYLCIAVLFGMLFGLIASYIVKRLESVIGKE